MRRWLAAVMLVCFGILVPLAAAPVRVCLAERALSSGDCDLAEPDCCQDGGENRDSGPCCLELEKMPDSPVRQPPLELPPAVFAELPEIVFAWAACLVSVVPAVEAVLTEPIRGPDSPAAYRAVLGIWRL